MVLTVGKAYVKAALHVTRGKIYYDTGEICYEGDCVTPEGYETMPCGHGVEYYKSGVIKNRGLFQRRGLVCGRTYYPSGNLRFEGYFLEPRGYGPAYPDLGSFFLEDGSLVFDGRFAHKFGGVGYPSVLIPEDYGRVVLLEQE